MLQRLEVKNFLALRDIALNLEPLTVIVGANASGKSTILEVLDRICALRLGYYRVLVEGGDFPERLDTMKLVLSPDSVRSFGTKSDIEFIAFTPQKSGWILQKKQPSDHARSWEFIFDDGKKKYNYQDSDDNLSYSHPLGKYVYELPKSLLLQANFSSLSKPSHSPLKTPVLERNGAGLATVCAYVQQEFPEAFSRVQEQLSAVIKGLKRFRIRRADATAKNYVNAEPDPNWTGIAEELIFDFDDAIGVPAKYVSEGTLLVLCILVAAARFEGDALILIDDIERGLHPKAVRDLIGALRKLQEINPKLQIVATSHSPYILDELKPEEVRVMARDPERGAIIKPLTEHPKFGKWQDTMTPGEFWSHVGEDWLLKQPEYA